MLNVRKDFNFIYTDMEAKTEYLIDFEEKAYQQERGGRPLLGRNGRKRRKRSQNVSPRDRHNGMPQFQPNVLHVGPRSDWCGNYRGASTIIQRQRALDGMSQGAGANVQNQFYYQRCISYCSLANIFPIPGLIPGPLYIVPPLFYAVTNAPESNIPQSTASEYNPPQRSGMPQCDQGGRRCGCHGHFQASWAIIHNKFYCQHCNIIYLIPMLAIPAPSIFWYCSMRQVYVSQRFVGLQMQFPVPGLVYIINNAINGEQPNIPQPNASQYYPMQANVLQGIAEEDTL